MTPPAVTLRSSPVMAAEPPDARNTQAAATSSACTRRRSGVRAVSSAPAAPRVDPDLVGPELGGERADQPDDAHLRRGVGRSAEQRALAGHGRDRDQAAGP